MLGKCQKQEVICTRKNTAEQNRWMDSMSENHLHTVKACPCTLIMLPCQRLPQGDGGREQLGSEELDRHSLSKRSRVMSAGMNVSARGLLCLCALPSTNTQQRLGRGEPQTHPECQSTEDTWLVTLKTDKVSKYEGGLEKGHSVKSPRRCDAQM